MSTFPISRGTDAMDRAQSEVYQALMQLSLIYRSEYQLSDEQQNSIGVMLFAGWERLLDEVTQAANRFHDRIDLVSGG